MDRERFGRALGFGAREAGKALWKAADAATSQPPATQQARAASQAPAARQAAREAAKPPARTGFFEPSSSRRAGETFAARPRVTPAAVRQGTRRFGEAMWGPVARASGVLWLELTGVFFGLFAVTAGVWLSRNLAGFHGSSAAQQHAWFAVGMLILFGWFTVSSFAKAWRRGR